MQGKFVAPGLSIDYTPGSLVAAGAVAIVGNNILGVAIRAIAANALGALCVEGIVDLVKVTGAITAGDNVFWDINGAPSGVGTTGAATKTYAAGDMFAGVAVEDAASGDADVRIKLGPCAKKYRT